MKQRSPAELLDLLNITDGGITTATGVELRLFDLEGPDPWHAPGGALAALHETLANAAGEIPDDALLQICILGHDNRAFLRDFAALQFDARAPLQLLRHARLEFLESASGLSGLSGARVVLAAGVRTPNRIGKGAKRRTHDAATARTTAVVKVMVGLLRRAGIAVQPLAQRDIEAIFAIGVLPQRIDTPNLRPNGPLCSLREQLFDAQLPAELASRGQSFAAWPDAFEAQGVYFATLTMQAPPEVLDFGARASAAFLTLPTTDYRASFAIYFPPQAAAEKHNQRGRRLQNAKAQTAGHVIDDKEVGKLGISEQLSWELANTAARPVHLSVQLTLWSQSRAALADLLERAKSTLRREDFIVFDETFLQDEAAYAALPGGCVNSAQWSQTTSTAALALLPIFSLPVGDAPALAFKNAIGGPFGLHPMARHRVNANGFVGGASGSGKSFFVNALITAMLGTNGQVVVVDHAGEDKSGYGLLVELMGEDARFVSVLSDQGRNHLDPLPHRDQVLAPSGGLLPAALARIEAVLDLLVSNQGAGKDEGLYRVDIGRAVQATYAEHAHPSLGDLAAELDRAPSHRAAELATLLRGVTDGPHGELFRPSSAAATSSLDLVIFDLFGVHDLPRNIADAVIYLASRAAADVAFASGDARPSYVVFDEAGELARNPALGALFGELFATARKWRAGVWAVTQAWSTLVQEAPIAADKIRVNAGTQVFLSHGTDEQAIATLAADWGLSQDERAWLRGLRTVKGSHSELLLRTDVMRHQRPERYSSVITFQPAPIEAVLFSSDPLDRNRFKTARRSCSTLIETLHHLSQPTARKAVA